MLTLQFASPIQKIADRRRQSVDLLDYPANQTILTEEHTLFACVYCVVLISYPHFSVFSKHQSVSQSVQ